MHQSGGVECLWQQLGCSPLQTWKPTLCFWKQYVTRGTNLKKQINMVDRTTPSTFENKDEAVSTPSLATFEFCSELFGSWEHTSDLSQVAIDLISLHLLYTQAYTCWSFQPSFLYPSISKLSILVVTCFSKLSRNSSNFHWPPFKNTWKSRSSCPFTL